MVRGNREIENGSASELAGSATVSSFGALVALAFHQTMESLRLPMHRQTEHEPRQRSRPRQRRCGNFILGRLGKDGLWGRNGNDMIQGHDGEADSIGGGAGTDTCHWDKAFDTRNGCEGGTGY